MQIPQTHAAEMPATSMLNIARWHYHAGNTVTPVRIPRSNSLEELGWTPAEALETCLRLRTFAEDWDAPGMEAYNDL